VANNSYPEPDGRFDPAGPHSTGRRKTVTPGVVESIAGPTTEGEQVAAGGFLRSDRPVGDEAAVLAKARFVGGSAGSPGTSRVNAAYPGTPSGP
jgi:hypothetical protein